MPIAGAGHDRSPGRPEPERPPGRSEPSATFEKSPSPTALTRFSYLERAPTGPVPAPRGDFFVGFQRGRGGGGPPGASKKALITAATRADCAGRRCRRRAAPAAATNGRCLASSKSLATSPGSAAPWAAYSFCRRRVVLGPRRGDQAGQGDDEGRRRGRWRRRSARPVTGSSTANSAKAAATTATPAAAAIAAAAAA